MHNALDLVMRIMHIRIMDIKSFREKKGLSQENFGAISDSDQTLVSRWENENPQKRVYPTREKARKMIRHFGGELTYEIIYGNPLQETGTG